jgi:hypothetical protein
MSDDVIITLRKTLGTIQNPGLRSWAHYKIAEIALDKGNVMQAAEELAEIIRINAEAEAREMEIDRMEKAERARIRDVQGREVKKDREYLPGPIPKEEIEKWDYKLNKREDALAARERALKEWEKKLQKWEKELQEKK